MRSTRNQKGFGLQSIFLLIIGVAGFIYGIKFIPYYMEAASINNIFSEVVNSSDASEMSDSEILIGFRKRALINDIKSIGNDDIFIDREDGNVTISASYTKKEKFIGNTSLVFEFNPTASNK